MTACLLCKTETTGSVGAAGLRWPNICQPCKDNEDAALADRVKAMGALQAAVIDELLLPRTAEERMHEDKTPEKAPEAPRYCAACGDPLDAGQFKWCSRACVEEDDGPYGPDDEDDEPEPEDEEPADEE